MRSEEFIEGTATLSETTQKLEGATIRALNGKIFYEENIKTSSSSSQEIGDVKTWPVGTIPLHRYMLRTLHASS